MCVRCRSNTTALYTSLMADGQSFLVCAACLRRTDRRHARLQTLLSQGSRSPVQ
jgi:hypothetical protein